MCATRHNVKINTLEMKITGQVQGVGFRPFIYRIAIHNNLTGWVQNRSGEVIVLVQGHEHNLNAFQDAVLTQHPPLAIPFIESVNSIECEPLNTFIISKSSSSAQAQRHIPPDFFTCNDCLAELTEPHERRYRYPFINCTQCGPRYTIINDLPYDRPNTSMSDFPLCTACYKEYSDTLDRRFHAQPLACSECGPELTFITVQDSSEKTASEKRRTGNEAALASTVDALKQGLIVALKGIGGYHLICDATNENAVQRLRKRKHRPDKPLAIMFSSLHNETGHDALSHLMRYCSPDKIEADAIASPQRPIVLIKTNNTLLAPAVNTGLNEIGAMLAYSPLHYLLLRDFGLPIVATSGNLSGEPVLTDNQQAQQRLQKIADAFLHHNRSILRPADDSVVRIIHHKKRLFRIGRGIAPLECNLPYTLKEPILAVGGQMKNTIALAWDNRLVISPHIGELDSKRSTEVFAQVIDDLCHLYRVTPKHIICDAHPDYFSSRYARTYANTHNISLSKVQHHKAHANIVCGAYDIKHKKTTSSKKYLVFTWDGTGLGDDKTLWGGEGFYGHAGNWQRVTSIKPFYLQGGDKAAREPWRSACALLWEKGIAANNFSTNKVSRSLTFQAWNKKLNTIQSSSMGRLFDAASALLGLGEISSFEGQGPMLLEALLDDALETNTETLSTTLHTIDKSALPLYNKNDTSCSNQSLLIIADWSDLLSLLLDDTQTIKQRALCFHLKIAETLIAQAKEIRAAKGDFCVGLSGGVFQNKFLTETILKRLEEENFKSFLPEQIPYNDAGLAFGQIIEAVHL